MYQYERRGDTYEVPLSLITINPVDKFNKMQTITVIKNQIPSLRKFMTLVQACIEELLLLLKTGKPTGGNAKVPSPLERNLCREKTFPGKTALDYPTVNYDV